MARNSDEENWRVVDQRSNFHFAERYDNATFLLKQPQSFQQVLLNITGMRNESSLRCRHTYCMQFSEFRLLGVAATDEAVLPQTRYLIAHPPKKEAPKDAADSGAVAGNGFGSQKAAAEVRENEEDKADQGKEPVLAAE